MSTPSASWAELTAWFQWAQEPLDEAKQTQLAIDAGTAFTKGSNYEFTLIERDTGSVVGSLRLNPRASTTAAEIGYWVRTDRTGRGYATAAARAATRAAFEHLDYVDSVHIHMDVANRASAAIPRKLGYRLRREGKLAIAAPARTGRGSFWVTTRDEWARVAQSVAS